LFGSIILVWPKIRASSGIELSLALTIELVAGVAIAIGAEVVAGTLAETVVFGVVTITSDLLKLV